MTKRTKTFFSLFVLGILISTIFGYYKIFVQEDFTVFLSDEEIPEVYIFHSEE